MKSPRRGWSGALGVALGAALALMAPAALNGQERPDTAAGTEQQIWERLRSLRPQAAPDSQPQVDTLRAQPQQVRLVRPGSEPAAAPAPARGGGQRDSIMGLLARLPGYVATEYSGAEATFLADSGRLQLRRNAEVVREGQQLRADTLIDYDEKTGIACGFGRPTISGGTLESPLTSDTVCYNIEGRVGVARNAETSISQGANWQLKADVYTRADSMYAHDAEFTDCDLPWPHKHYTFEAGKVKVVQNNTMVARDVTLKFADVPVFWLPFMVQSLSRGRRSGLLMPRFGINDIARTSARYSRSIQDVGFYLALNDYMGAEVAMDWMSNNYTSLRGALDYSVVRQFLSGQLTFRRFWKDEGGSEFTLAASSGWQPDEFTRLSARANFASASEFVRQRSIDPRELTQSIDSNLSLSRQLGWGSLSLGATRMQYLSDGKVRTTPSFGLSINSISLFDPEPGEERWYSNASWSGNFDGRVENVSLGDRSRELTAQNYRNASGNLSSRFNVGKLGLSQTFSFGEDRRFARRDSFPQGDTTALVDLPDATEQQARWGLNASFQQNLIGTTTSITPSLQLGGELRRNERTGNELLSAPTRVNFNASLQTALFGFWPGVGPIQRVRHRLSPSLSYSYSPEAKADSLQRQVFGGTGVGERNTLTLGLNQTFEGKRKPREGGAAPEPVGAMGADSAANDTTSGPRRLPAGESPIILLSIATDAVVYDFVQAREGEGVQTQTIGNSIQSDLFRNLQLRFSHDLFERLPLPEGSAPGTRPARRFKPHLQSVTASLRLDSDSWLFRVLGLGRGRDLPEERGEVGQRDAEATEAGVAEDRTRPELGVIGTSRRGPEGTQAGPVGTWNASLDYSLNRPRESTGGRENQMLMGNLSFQPTQQWMMTWRSGYNFTIGEFTDHYLTLTRRMHDWDANFHVTKTQTGNFSFSFQVHLRANPDIKMDYEQNDMGGIRRF